MACEHRDLNFPKNNLNFDLNNKTMSPSSNLLFKMSLSCQVFVLSLWIF